MAVLKDSIEAAGDVHVHLWAMQAWADSELGKATCAADVWQEERQHVTCTRYPSACFEGETAHVTVITMLAS